MTDTATYLYAVTRPIPSAALVGLRGIGGGAVRAIPVGDLTCVASSVDLADFDEEPLARNLENLAWLERAAREHDDVVQAAAALATAVPLRLATICRDDASAVERVRARAGDAAALLDQLDGCEEWGVKIFDVPDDAKDDPVSTSVGASGAAPRDPSGTSYLLRRRAELAARAESAARTSEQVDAVFSHLAEFAAQARRHRLQDPQLSGVKSPMLLNAAFLVAKDRVGGFHQAVERLATTRPDGAVVMTGPWPAYSFATLDEP